MWITIDKHTTFYDVWSGKKPPVYDDEREAWEGKWSESVIRAVVLETLRPDLIMVGGKHSIKELK